MIEKLVDNLIKKGDATEEDRKILMFGFNKLLQNVCIVFISILLGWIFHFISEVILFLISFSLIRSFSGGFHFLKQRTCCITSFLILLLFLCSLRIVPCMTMTFLYTFLFMLSIPIIVKYAPLEAVEKPLDVKEKVFYRRKTLLHLSLEILIILSLLITKQIKFAFSISVAIFLAACLLLIEVLRLKLVEKKTPKHYKR